MKSRSSSRQALSSTSRPRVLAASTWSASAGDFVAITPGGAAGGVHDAVQRARGRAEFAYRSLRLLLVGDVGAEEVHAGTEVLDAP